VNSYRLGYAPASKTDPKILFAQPTRKHDHLGLRGLS
jgi:hypothetical protein